MENSTFHLGNGDEKELSLIFSEHDGSLRIDTGTTIYFLPAGHVLDLLQWLAEKRDALWRAVQRDELIRQLQHEENERILDMVRDPEDEDERHIHPGSLSL